MKHTFLAGLFLVTTFFVFGQKAEDVIHAKEVERIERVLAADDMRGRRAGSPEIDKAAAFIADEFKKAGLQPVQGNSYLQEFIMLRPTQKELKYKADGADIDPKNILVVTSKSELEVDEKSGFEVRTIKAGDNSAGLFNEAVALNVEKKNLVILVDTSYSSNFSRLAFLKRQMFQSPYSKIFILGTGLPKEFKVKAEHSFNEVRYANVVGILPGKSRKEEQVIFSAHYDHIGVNASRAVNGDSIFNGANDDAAGTTAVIMLANYFKKLGNNERTLIFAAFTAEESGGFGSQYFSRQFDPKQVVAMFNIEMIGTESKWGRNSAFITGYGKNGYGSHHAKEFGRNRFYFLPGSLYRSTIVLPKR